MTNHETDHESDWNPNYPFRDDTWDEVAPEDRVVAIREDGSYRTEPDEEPYDLHDPKGPRYHSVHADIWDLREGK